jgi:hypothetical protein
MRYHFCRIQREAPDENKRRENTHELTESEYMELQRWLLRKIVKPITRISYITEPEVLYLVQPERTESGNALVKCM